MGRLILVSNRLPVTLRRGRDGNQEIIRSSGGLVSALAPVHAAGDGLWIGNLGDEPDPATSEALADRRYVAVPVSSAENRGYYLGFSNSALWPLFHYLPEQCRFSSAQFEVYRRVNERFADMVAARATEDDLIWVHDYQLMLLPQLLRERLPRARIGFFLHTPFPSSEMFRLLPQREEVLRHMLGADLIGVHTYDYARHLISSLLRVLGIHTREGVAEVEGRRVQIATQPIGIDVEAMRSTAYSRAADNRIRDLTEMLHGRKMILGMERLDYSKGLPHKLAAFRHLLSTYPQRRRNIVYVQVVFPSREEIQGYREQRQQIEQMISAINGEFGEPGLVPIHYIHRSISPTELGALYRLADVGFVLPIRDGMNVVAKEFVACQKDGHGVLLLSEFAGAASELGEAVRANPWDVEGTAAALERALEMSPEERERRMTAMSRRVETNDVHAWVRSALRSLQRPADTAPVHMPRLFEPEELAAEIRPALERARAAAFLLDYDGTLREFTVRPEDAIPTDSVLRLLGRLGAFPNSRTVLITGRDRKTIDGWFSGIPIALVSEHGAWTRLKPEDEWLTADNLADTGWKAEVGAILDEYVARTPGASVEEKSAALVWHYRAADADLARWQARELTAHLDEYLANQPVEVIEGAAIVEVRQQGITKGAAYHTVEQEIGPFDFKLAIGDDTTDEELFDAVGEDAITVHVGPDQSRARCSLGSPADVRAFLRMLLPNVESE